MISEINLLSRPTPENGGCGPLLHGYAKPSSPLRQQVFEFIRAQGHAARSDVSSALGISAGSATTITADLIDRGYLQETQEATREVGRGRPKVALQVVSGAAFVIGVKLAFNRHRAVLADFSGNVIAQKSMPSGDARRSLAELIDETAALMDGLLEASGKSAQDVHAVGIGLPGIIDHDTGMILWSPLLRDRDVDFNDAFTPRYAVPILVDNDANMVTLAELWFGEGRARSDFAVVTVESGVGMGLVLRNQLYRGAHGMGLELGHTKVQLDGALCQCGQRGCLEAYIADYALIREAATALGKGFDPKVRPEEILAMLFEHAKAGHKAAENIFRRAGRYLSLGLSNVIQLFDPEIIILSGERMQYEYLYAEEVLEAMEGLTLTEGRKPCRVTINAWDDLVWARGAAALALSHVTSALLDEARAA